MKAIRAYLKSHPQDLDVILSANPLKPVALP